MQMQQRQAELDLERRNTRARQKSDADLAEMWGNLMLEKQAAEVCCGCHNSCTWYGRLSCGLR